MGEAEAAEEEDEDIHEGVDGGGGGAAGDRPLGRGFNLDQRARYAWEGYQAFLADPGQRCRDCWLLQTHCTCAELPVIRVPSRVVVLMHPAELGRLRASNTAKLLLRVGAELCCWGHEEHDQRLRSLLKEVVAEERAEREEAAAADIGGSCSACACEEGQPRPASSGGGGGGASASGAVVLFPSADARAAGEIAAEIAAGQPSEAGGGGSGGSAARLPRCIVVLDGGWKETRKMNQSIDQAVPRCFVSNATRGEYGGTRKYRGNDAANRVQTAAAFIALLKELNDDHIRIAQLQACLAGFTEAFDRQIRWSGVIFEPRVTLPTAVSGSPAGG